MRYLQSIVASTLLIFSLALAAHATCAGTMGNYAETYPSGTACINLTWTKANTWRPEWADGFKKYIRIIDMGVSNFNVSPCVGCWPAFSSAYWQESGTGAYFVQETKAANVLTIAVQMWHFGGFRTIFTTA